MTNGITLHDLKTIQNEPRLHDLLVAERLGFARPRSIRKLIEANKSEIESHGSLATARGKSRGQEFTEYYLNEAQTLLLCMFSRTQKAAEVRKAVIEVYQAYRSSQSASTTRDIHLIIHELPVRGEIFIEGELIAFDATPTLKDYYAPAVVIDHQGAIRVCLAISAPEAGYGGSVRRVKGLAMPHPHLQGARCQDVYQLIGWVSAVRS